MLCGPVWGCCKKGGSQRSHFLLHNQISGERNEAVGVRGGCGAVPVTRGAKSQAQCLGSARKEKRH